MAGRWSGPRHGLEPAVRRFLRARPRSYLLHLAGNRAFALAAAATLLAIGTARGLPPIDLSDVAAGNGGFIMNGIDADDRSGRSVSGAGDVNGDGVPDIIVGAPRADPGGNSWAGESYVVFGKADGTAVDLADVAAGNGGFVMNGIDEFDYSGRSVSGAGDVNGDGLDDIIVGAPYADHGGKDGVGESYVVFGKADTAPVNLSDVVAGNGGFVMNGIGRGPNDSTLTGWSVSGAGDVNGDGLADVIVGAPRLNNAAGESYVVFGKADTEPVNLADVVAGNGGFMIGTDSFGLAGWSVSGAGDVNGDGLSDVIVGAPAYSLNPVHLGKSYVVFGKADTEPVNLADVVAGDGGFVIISINLIDFAGWSVSGAGDVNGDGLADVIVGSLFTHPGGESYVVFGKADGTPVDLADVVAGVGGFVMNGIDEFDGSGRSVSGAGDVNGDGLDDVIVGAYGADPGGSYSGESYVVFGKTDTAAVNLADIVAGDGGFAMTGIDPYDRSGASVSAAGDVNGDGLADVIVGAPGADPGGNGSAGESYVVFSPVVWGDLDGDGSVGAADLLLLLAGWGRCPEPCVPYCPGDLNRDCVVGAADLLFLLVNWG